MLSGHDALSKWYFHLNACFYHSSNWSTDFFTPGIKSDGNTYCIIAIPISLIAVYYIIRSFKRSKSMATVRFDWIDTLPLIVCIAAAISLWVKGNAQAMPAYDEIFSAQNSAGIHPFQTVSFYMLPNNHIFFNFLNNVLFHSFADKVATGRIISLLAYVGVTVSLFLFLNTIIRNRWITGIAVIAIISQFLTWAFSFQSRGYELYLLAEWASVISLFMYTTGRDGKWLKVNFVSCVAGYFCMPSFLYFHVGEVLFMVTWCLAQKQTMREYWKYQVAIVFATYILYLPTLCFSGLDALAHNNYVAPMKATFGSFVNWVFPQLNDNYVSHIFSNIQAGKLPLNLVMVLAPVLLIFVKKNKPFRAFGAFYCSLVLTFVLLVLIMKRLPFERNLIGHYSVALAGLLLLSIQLANSVFKRFPQTVALSFTFIVPLLLAIHFFRTNDDLLRETPYEYDVNKLYTEKVRSIEMIPPSASVYASEEEFCSGYICLKKGCKLNKCPDGTEDYYIKQEPESAPAYLNSNYTLLKNDNGTLIYHKK